MKLILMGQLITFEANPPTTDPQRGWLVFLSTNWSNTMTKNETEQLRKILASTEKCLGWIKSERIEVCSVGNITLLAYTNKDGRTLGTSNKHSGSPIQHLDNATDNLASLIVRRGFKS